MKKILLCGIFALIGAPLWAQSSPLSTSAQCTELNSFLHSAYTGWQLGPQPKDFKPLHELDACEMSSTQEGGALCVKQTASLELAKQTASVWLKELSMCLNAKPASTQLKKITVASATHELMEFEPLHYRGMPMKMNLRIRYEGSNPTALVTWYLAPQPGNVDAPKELNICPMVKELTDSASLASNWASWQGPILERSENFTQFICAKVPHQAASRFDCDLRVTPTSLNLSTRWLYDTAQTEKVASFASDIAGRVAACEVGMEWKKGVSRHVVDIPKKQIRIDVVSNRNDVGRGPSVSMTVQHWK